MKLYWILILLFILLPPVQVNAHKLSLEERAVDLVIVKHDKQLKKRLKGTGVNPAYMVWKKDDCNESVKVGTHQAETFSTMEWFDVNVCTKKVEKVCLLKGSCEWYLAQVSLLTILLSLRFNYFS